LFFFITAAKNFANSPCFKIRSRLHGDNVQTLHVPPIVVALRFAHKTVPKDDNLISRDLRSYQFPHAAAYFSRADGIQFIITKAGMMCLSTTAFVFVAVLVSIKAYHCSIARIVH